MDEHCSIDLDAPTANWLIYGHNMADGSMFGQLTRYRSEDFYKTHTTFTFNTIYETAAWQVVAALDTTLGADELPYYTFLMRIPSWSGSSAWTPSQRCPSMIPA